ncbi:DUF192 domain-containing protein [Candidatus Woesearchaeota archaeon]|nr:DUF192 domain-containing protein [Candidatus Woesearchaeota archaeon]
MTKYRIIMHKGRIIANLAKYCDTAFTRAMGLMFTLPLKKEQACILVANNESIMETSIHMFFVFYPIDVLWLNEKKEVVDKRISVWPFTPLLIPKLAAKYVIELPRKRAENLVIGTKLDF